MAKYLFTASYTDSGLAGLMSAGASSRAAALGALAASVGGSIEGMYWAFGDDDALVICDLPDNEAAAAVALTVGASGAATVSTTVLLDASEVDAAIGRTPEYRPPGA